MFLLGNCRCKDSLFFYIFTFAAAQRAEKVLWICDARRLCVSVSAEPRLHAALVSAAKVMRSIKCSLVYYFVTFYLYSSFMCALCFFFCLSLYHNCDSTATRLRYDDTTTHSTRTKVIEITICVRFDCESAIRLRYDYDEKLTCSFFARVEWKQERAIRRSRNRIVVESQL